MQIDNKSIVSTVLVFNIQTIIEVIDIHICKHFQLFRPLISLPFTDKAKESENLSKFAVLYN